MKAKSYTPYVVWRLGLIAATLALGACDAINEIANRNDDDNVHYYLSLGDSLAIGVQPDSNGIFLPTSDSYPHQLYDSIRPAFEADGTQELELNLLGCGGETLDDMINGGDCIYLAGSQLDAAVDFLTDNGDRVHLVTIDIGGNDFRNADCIITAVDDACVNVITGQIATNLATVLTTLRNAASPNTTIVGMNYYNPYLGAWIVDAAGQVLATESVRAAVVFNDALSMTYLTAGIPMANVYAAFESDDFTLVPSMLPPPDDMLPRNVVNICTFTYMCDAPPVGPDIHANTAGYSLIAQTLEAALP